MSTSQRPFRSFLTLFVLLVAFSFGFFPLGLLALIGGRMTYGTWEAAWFAYLLSCCSGFLGIIGIVPIVGVWAHWWVVTNYVLPWADNHSVYFSWLTTMLASSGSVIASICWAALSFRWAESRSINGEANRRARPAAGMERIGLPLSGLPGVARGSTTARFWVNTATAIAGLALILFLYRDWIAFIVVLVFTIFSLVAIFRPPAAS